MEILNEKEYVIKIGEEISRFQKDTTEDKCFLSSSDIKNDVYNLHLYKDRENFLIGDLYRIRQQVKRLGGIFCDLLSHTQVFLYDNETFINLYPNGFHTEDKIFIPLNKFEGFISSEPTGPRGNVNLSPLFFVNILTSFLENKYQVKFSENEHSEIIKKHTFDYYYSNSPSSSIVRSNIDFVSSSDLKRLMEKDGFDDRRIKLLTGSISSKYVDNLLSNSTEIHDQTNPLSKLKDEVLKNLSAANQEIISTENINELMKASEYSLNGDKLNQIGNSLSKIVASIIQHTINNKGSLIDIYAELNKDWIPVALNLEDTFFPVVFYDLVNQLSKFESQFLSATKNINELIREINKNEFCSGNTRDLMIKLGTGSRGGQHREEFRIIESNKYEIENDFFEACKNGDFAAVKEILSTKDSEKIIDISTEDNKGFRLAIQAGKTDLALHLLFGNDLGQTVKIDSSVFKIIELVKQKVVLEAICLEGDYDVLTHYDDILKAACASDSEKVLYKLLNLEQTTESMKINALQLNLLVGQRKMNLFMIDTILDKVMTYPHKNDEIRAEIENAFISAVGNKYMDIAKKFVFDYDLHLSDKNTDLLKEHAPEAINLFTIREINKKLTIELSDKDHVPTKTKKSKL